MDSTQQRPRRSRRTYLPAIVAAIGIAILIVLLVTDADLPWVHAITFAAVIGSLGFAFVDMLVRDIRRTYHDPIGERVSVLGVMVLETILLFATTYLLISQHPDQFVGMRTPLDAVYFTMTTLMTIGFGDVAAEGQWARGTVLIQMLFSVLVLSSAVRLFTSLVRSMTVEAGRRGSAETA